MIVLRGVAVDLKSILKVMQVRTDIAHEPVNGRKLGMVPKVVHQCFNSIAWSCASFRLVRLGIIAAVAL